MNDTQVLLLLLAVAFALNVVLLGVLVAGLADVARAVRGQSSGSGISGELFNIRCLLRERLPAPPGARAHDSGYGPVPTGVWAGSFPQAMKWPP